MTTRQLALVGLEAALTVAMANAQLAGLSAVADELLELKRNVMLTRRQLEEHGDATIQ